MKHARFEHVASLPHSVGWRYGMSEARNLPRLSTTSMGEKPKGSHAVNKSKQTKRRVGNGRKQNKLKNDNTRK